MVRAKLFPFASSILPALALVSLTVAGPAQAAPTGTGCTDKSDAGTATAKFKPYGEHLLVTDNSKDGHSAIGHVQITWGSATHYWYWNRDGAGTTRDVNLSYKEGRSIFVGAYTGDWSGSATKGIDHSSNTVIPTCRATA
ncbi:hypothetical protein [Streptomyces sp. MAR4 CNX-425]|uniref:hypothetical protein n=1 Tax=Streptomyces sp. MAR4 CNX-425 TaxID=3406343 RepID=UPI003B503429